MISVFLIMTIIRTRHEEPNSIRGRYGLTDTRNATHGSDSIESAIREIAFFFPDFDSNLWLKEEENHFRDGHNVEFFPNEWLHKLKTQ
jgi:nucleoside-diphosphate kinase